MIARPHLALLLATLPTACSQPSDSGPKPPPQAATPAPEESPPPPVFLKGQLHAHTGASGDSETPVADVVRWYDEHDYDFIVITDHNRITEAEGTDGMLVFPGVELTQNLDVCYPPPEGDNRCLLHVNALFVDPSRSDDAAAVTRPGSPDRVELFDHGVRVSGALGGIAQLNHPNFHYAADARVLGLVARRGLTIFELANEAVDSNNDGDERHPSLEVVWDDVLSSGARLWGTATDDAHHYYDAAEVRARGELAHTGDRGFVMVRAERNRDSIRDAIQRGDFYSSSGVLLEDVRAAERSVEVVVSAQSPGEHEFRFIGNGRVVHRERGREARFDAGRAKLRYVRVVVEDPKGRKAWTQPHFLRDGGRT